MIRLRVFSSPERRKESLAILSIYALLAAYVLLFSLLTVWNGDAIAYSFYIPSEGGDDCHIPVHNLKEIWESQINHYRIWNGRFIVHFFVQLFCGIIGKTGFSICNALIWVLLAREISKIISKGKQNIRITSATVLFCILVFGSLTFTPPFAINYVWVAYITLLWLKLFFEVSPNGIGSLIAVALFSFIAGMLHEGFSVPICGALLILLITGKCRMTGRQWLMGILYGIGAVILIAAPGNYSRLQESTSAGGTILRLCEQLVYCLIFPCIYLIIRAFSNASGKRVARQMDCDMPGLFPKLFLYTLIFISLGFCLLTGNLGRGLTVYNLGFALLSLQYISTRRTHKDIFIILSVFALAVVGWNGLTTYIQNEKTETIIKEYKASDAGKIYLDDGLFLFNQLETCQRRNTYTNLIRSENAPDKPALRIYPASTTGMDLEKDTNMILPLGEQSWLCVRSATRPARFVVDKTISIGPFQKRLSGRILDFDSTSEIFVDSTSNNSIVIYSNRHPGIRASVAMESCD